MAFPSLGFFGRRAAVALLALLAWAASFLVAEPPHALPWLGVFVGTGLALLANLVRVFRRTALSLRGVFSSGLRPLPLFADALWGGMLATAAAAFLLWLSTPWPLMGHATSAAVFFAVSLGWKVEWCFPTLDARGCRALATQEAQRLWAERPAGIDRIEAHLFHTNLWPRALVAFRPVPQAQGAEDDAWYRTASQRLAEPYILPVFFEEALLDRIEAQQRDTHRGRHHGATTATTTAATSGADSGAGVLWQGPRTAHERAVFEAANQGMAGAQSVGRLEQKAC